MRLQEAFENYLKYSYLSERSKIIYRPFFEGFLEVNKNIDIIDINVKHILEYRKTILNRSKDFNHKAMVCLRSLFRWLNQNYQFNVLDFNKISVPKVLYQHFGVLSKEEIEKLRNFIKYQHTRELNKLRDQVIFETIYSTGLRTNELRTLKISQIDLNKSEIQVVGKGNKPAKVYLTNKAKKLIQEYLSLRHDNSPYLIVGHDFVNHKPTDMLCREFIRMRFNLWGKKCGLKHCHPHMLRKSFCTEIWNQSKDLLQTSRLARHADVSVTQRYVQTDESQDHEAHSLYLGNNRRFSFEEKREGRTLIKADIFCAEGVDMKKAKLAMKEAVDKLLT